MRFLGLLQRHFVWKLLSVLLATGIWFTITLGQQERSRNELSSSTGPISVREIKDIPILVIRPVTDTNHYIFNPSVVRAKLKGDSVQLARILPADIEVIARLVNLPRSRRFSVELELGPSRGLRDKEVIQYLDPGVVEVEVEGGLGR